MAILENGQYNTSWKYIHAMPEAGGSGSQRFKSQAVVSGAQFKICPGEPSMGRTVGKITEAGKKDTISAGYADDWAKSTVERFQSKV